jgi:hypothetical protein
VGGAAKAKELRPNKAHMRNGANAKAMRQNYGEMKTCHAVNTRNTGQNKAEKPNTANMKQTRLKAKK